MGLPRGVLLREGDGESDNFLDSIFQSFPILGSMFKFLSVPSHNFFCTRAIEMRIVVPLEP